MKGPVGHSEFCCRPVAGVLTAGSRLKSLSVSSCPHWSSAHYSSAPAAKPAEARVLAPSNLAFCLGCCITQNHSLWVMTGGNFWLLPFWLCVRMCVYVTYPWILSDSWPRNKSKITPLTIGSEKTGNKTMQTPRYRMNQAGYRRKLWMGGLSPVRKFPWCNLTVFSHCLDSWACLLGYNVSFVSPFFTSRLAWWSTRKTFKKEF